MNHPYNKVQLYADNTAIKYPLEDTTTSGAPNDLLVDLAVTAPSTVGTVYVTNIVVTATYAFVTLELYSGGLYSALAHVLVRRPAAWKIYPMTAVDGCHGWLVFGPGIKRPYSLVRTPTAVDPRCVLHAPAAAKTFHLSVNGFVYDLPAVLKIRNNTYISQSIEDRDVGLGTDQTCLVLRRNDAVLDQNMIKTGLETPSTSRGAPLYTINGIAPNEDGVFTLYFETKDAMEFFGAGAINTDGILTGIVLQTDNIEGCVDEASALYNKMQNGRTGHGLAYDLPLDSLVPPEPARMGCTGP